MAIDHCVCSIKLALKSRLSWVNDRARSEQHCVLTGDWRRGRQTVLKRAILSVSGSRITADADLRNDHSCAWTQRFVFSDYAMPRNKKSTSAKKKLCPCCNTWLHPESVARHLRGQAPVLYRATQAAQDDPSGPSAWSFQADAQAVKRARHSKPEENIRNQTESGVEGTGPGMTSEAALPAASSSASSVSTGVSHALLSSLTHASSGLVYKEDILCPCSSVVRSQTEELHIASDDYRRYLEKKKLSEAVDHADKLLAIDALGVVMIKHGEEFGENSAYGQSLVNFGRAHCTIASLQESFAMAFEDTYLASIRQSEDEIKEYQAQRKKLESRRLSYDAAITKLEKVKGSKKEKEKEREEAEEEYDNAKARYEETLEDVRARMWAIQENEVVQLRELTNFLDLELSFIRSFYEELQRVRNEWIDECVQIDI
ncbi:hypothetical protein NUW54_g9692 [Trametes sanguinea]|uniref:Uncharacterized protein n=1 Tax=Trametes sanguinea TaxID=158606 RepID=A0ACC1P6Q0_9APHY|nr:hypothetical protein NUW54_g9692 [Trametes sanguinea]